jgi:hypothetical protein
MVHYGYLSHGIIVIIFNITIIISIYHICLQ